MASIQILIGRTMPKTKAEIKRAINECKDVNLKDYSMFNNFGFQSLRDMPDGEYFFAGPDCNKDRRWYGSIVIKTINDETRSYKVN